MDNTLITMECIDELAKRAGVGDEVAAITAAAMAGELDFAESFTRRLSTLAGLPASELDDILANLPLMPGVERLATDLKALGTRVVIASGGFTHIASAGDATRL